MKKSIMDLAGAKTLSKAEQKNLIGGIDRPKIPCGYVCLPNCTTGCPM